MRVFHHRRLRMTSRRCFLLDQTAHTIQVGSTTGFGLRCRNAKLRKINNKRLVSTEDATYKPLDCPFSLVWTPTCFAIEGSAGEAPVEIYRIHTADYSEYRISQLSSSKFDQFSKNVLQKLCKNHSTSVFFFHLVWIF